VSKKSTIHDVAALANVSIKTVSRVMNREASVKASTRERVQEAAKQLNYRPNLSARGLAGGKSYMIAILYSNLSPGYLIKVQEGVLAACEARDYGLAIKPVDYEADNYIEDLKVWLQHVKVDGVVLTPPFGARPEIFDLLKELSVKAVTISEKPFGDLKAVAVDEVAASRAITSHFLNQGHTRIGFITGDMDHQSAQLRYDGYCLELEEAGLSVEDNLVARGDFNYAGGLMAAQALLDLSELPTAIFASNDDMAAAVLRLAHEKGLKVPDDIAVAGFDDTPLAEQVWPPLTTVHQPVIRMATMAAEKLITDITGDRETGAMDQVSLMPYELIIRASSKAS
jgi:LacI family transcriptional regulator